MKRCYLSPAVFGLLAIPTILSAADWKDALQERFRSAYTFDEVTATEDVASAAKTKTISLNQPPQEVETISGKPETIVRLGSPVIYNYGSMKVIFTDGKVSDVQ